MINLKSAREINIMRSAGAILGDLIIALRKLIKPGVTTLALDKFAEEFIRAKGGAPAFKGYIPAFKKHYPATLCTSVNESIVHEIPSSRELKDGDIISIDVGIEYNGYYADTAYTFIVGKVSDNIQKLLKVTEEALYKAIAEAHPGNRLSDISAAIQAWAEKNSFSVVREFTGHGIGAKLHEEPVILNFGPPHQGPTLKPGMTLAIEPMLAIGTGEAKILEDGWTAVTRDGNPSAHFEHTIAITENEPQILTLPSNSRNRQ